MHTGQPCAQADGLASLMPQLRRTALEAAIVEVPTVAQLPRRAAIHHAAKGLTAVR
jgi:hypothetical protein